jgi:hypothetical protein
MHGFDGEATCHNLGKLYPNETLTDYALILTLK